MDHDPLVLQRDTGYQLSRSLRQTLVKLERQHDVLRSWESVSCESQFYKLKIKKELKSESVSGSCTEDDQTK